MADWTQEDTQRFLSESDLFSIIPDDARAGATRSRESLEKMIED